VNVLTIVQVVAVVCAGLLAGIYFSYRAGAYYALQELSASSFVQFAGASARTGAGSDDPRIWALPVPTG